MAQTPADLQQQIKDLNDQIKQAGGLGIDFADAMRRAGNDIDKLNNVLKQLNKQYDNLVNNADYVYRTFQDITSELKNQNLLLKLGRSSFKSLTDIAQDLNYYQKGNNDLTDKQFKKIKQNIEIQKDELDFIIDKLSNSRGEFKQQQLLGYLQQKNYNDLSKYEKERLKQLTKEYETFINAKEAQKSSIPILEKELNLSKQISNTRKDLGGLSKGIAGVISKFGGSLASFLNVQEAIDDVEEYNKKLVDGALKSKAVQEKLLDIEKRRLAEERAGTLDDVKRAEYEKEAYDVKQSAIASVNNLGNKFKSLGVLVSGLGTGLKKALTDPLTIMTFILERALTFNKISVDISKNYGYGAKEADKMAQSLANISNSSSNLNFTLQNAAEAMSELNTKTGLVANYSADTLATQIMLTKQFGLTGEEAAGIYEYSVLTGKSSSQVNDNMVGAFVAARNSLKVGANFKQVMAEAAKVSGQLAMNFKNNPEAITKAIVQAKALGTSLEDAKSQGEKLLEFGSSLESELKAELLTGQQMNLERARAAALMGDQATVMKELANQGMTLEKFQNMNVLAQQAFAEALGTSADKLSDQLRKQKLAQESGKSLAEITKQEALDAEKRQAVQDKFNAAILKLQDFFGNLVGGPLGSFLGMLSEALDVVNLILLPFKIIYDITSMIGNTIGGWLNSLGIVGTIIKGIASAAIIYAAYTTYAAVATALAATIIGGLVAPYVAGAAAALVLSAGFGLLNAQPVGDMISPADGKTQVSTKEGGLFELSKNDDVLAGPGLANAAKGGKGESIAPSIDLTPMIAAINQVKASVDKLYSKDTTINMDGKRVGTTLTQGSYKVA